MRSLIVVLWPYAWSERLAWLAVAALPFQQALTLDVGFPLKLTEIFAVAAILAAAIERRRGWRQLPTIWLLVLLGTLVVLSTLWAIIQTGESAPTAAYPRGLYLDVVLYAGYGLLSIMFAAVVGLVMDPRQLGNAIGWAVRLAALYCVVQFVLWSVGSDALALVNGNVQLGSLYASAIPRNGPLLEGNYLGFIAAFALFLCWRSRDFWGIAICVLLTLYSQSTGAVIAIAVGLVAVVILRPRKRLVIVAASTVIVGVFAFTLIPFLRRFATVQLTKLGLIPNELGEAFGYSLRGRTANAETGLAIAADHPILGVGPGRYALHFHDYLDLSNLPDNYGQNLVRPIANNVYAQIAAEFGFPALIVFVLILALLLLRARTDSDGLVGMVAAIAVGLMAFPAWSGFPVWIGIAAAIACTRGGTDDVMEVETVPADPSDNEMPRGSSGTDEQFDPR